MGSLANRLAAEAKDVRILTIDIETKPMKVWSFGLRDQFHPIEAIIDHGGLLCFAAKWVGEKEILFFSEWADGYEAMVKAAHRLLSEADVVVHYNGDKFDTKKLNWEFDRLRLGPPRPFKSIDLMKTNRARFALPSLKLDYLAQQMGVGAKTKHSGLQLWIDCLTDETPKAQSAARSKMERYNAQDVRITEKVYLRLLPWLTNSPHLAMYTGHEYSCPYCGKKGLNREGVTHTLVQSYWLNQCPNCGGWSRSTTRLQNPTITRAIR